MDQLSKIKSKVLPTVSQYLLKSTETHGSSSKFEIVDR